MLLNQPAKKQAEQRPAPPLQVFGIHPMVWVAAVLLIGLAITAIVSVVVEDAARNANLDTLLERARVRVKGLAYEFYGHIDELAAFRSALEGTADSHEFLGSRPWAPEAVAMSIRDLNPGRITATAFLKEVDRVHIDALELQLDQAFPNMVRKPNPFELNVFAPGGGFELLSETNETRLQDRRVAAIGTAGRYNASTTFSKGRDLASDDMRYALIEAAARYRTQAVSPPNIVTTRLGRRRGLVVIDPVYSHDGLTRWSALKLLPQDVDVASIAGEVAPGVNRITSPQHVAQQHAHSASDACGAIFRSTCLPFNTTRSGALAAYNQSLIDVREGRREHPLEPCSSRCADGHLLRGHVVGAFFFDAIANQAQVLRDGKSPLAIYSEDVTDLVRAGEGQDGGYAAAAIEGGLVSGDPGSPYERLQLGAGAQPPAHSLPPGLGEFQFGLKDGEDVGLAGSDEAQEAVVSFLRERAREDSRQVLGFLLPVGNRVWSIHVAGTDEFFDNLGRRAFVAPLLAGVLVSFLVSAMLGAMYFSFRHQQIQDHEAARVLRLKAEQHAHERLVSFIVHEQRNPLHLCSGSLGMLKDGMQSAEQALVGAMGAVQAMEEKQAMAGARCDHAVGKLIEAMGGLREAMAGTGAREAEQTQHSAPVAAAGHQLDASAQVISSSIAQQALRELGGARQALVEAMGGARSTRVWLGQAGLEIEASKGDVGTADQGTETLHRLVNDMLDLSRLRQGKLPVTVAPVDPRRLIKAAASSHQTFAQVPLRFHISAAVPSVILADSVRITQILANGLTNAAKFCTKGYILLDLDIRLRAVPREVLEEEVRSSQLARRYLAQGASSPRVSGTVSEEDHGRSGGQKRGWRQHAVGDRGSANDAVPIASMLRWVAGEEQGADGSEHSGMSGAHDAPDGGGVTCGCEGQCGSGLGSRRSSGGEGATGLQELMHEQLQSCEDACGGKAGAGAAILRASDVRRCRADRPLAAQVIRNVRAACRWGDAEARVGSVGLVMASVPSVMDRVVDRGSLLGGLAGQRDTTRSTSRSRTSQGTKAAGSSDGIGHLARVEMGGAGETHFQPKPSASALADRLGHPLTSASYEPDNFDWMPGDTDRHGSVPDTSARQSQARDVLPRRSKQRSAGSETHDMGAGEQSPGSDSELELETDERKLLTEWGGESVHLVPMLVFRVIDTGKGLGKGRAREGNKSLFNAYTTGETKQDRSAIVSSASSEHSHSDDSSSASGREQSRDRSTSRSVSQSVGDVDASTDSDDASKDTYSPKAPDGSASSVAKQKGSGLGLAMAQELTKQMGGTIELRTEKRRKRTVLEVALPLRPPWRVIRRMEAGAVARLPTELDTMRQHSLAEEARALHRALDVLAQGDQRDALSACSAKAIHSRNPASKAEPYQGAVASQELGEGPREVFAQGAPAEGVDQSKGSTTSTSPHDAAAGKAVMSQSVARAGSSSSEGYWRKHEHPVKQSRPSTGSNGGGKQGGEHPSSSGDGAWSQSGSGQGTSRSKQSSADRAREPDAEAEAGASGDRTLSKRKQAVLRALQCLLQMRQSMQSENGSFAPGNGSLGSGREASPVSAPAAAAAAAAAACAGSGGQVKDAQFMATCLSALPDALRDGLLVHMRSWSGRADEKKRHGQKQVFSVPSAVARWSGRGGQPPDARRPEDLPHPAVSGREAEAARSTGMAGATGLLSPSGPPLSSEHLDASNDMQTGGAAGRPPRGEHRHSLQSALSRAYQDGMQADGTTPASRHSVSDWNSVFGAGILTPIGLAERSTTQAGAEMRRHVSWATSQASSSLADGESTGTAVGSSRHTHSSSPSATPGQAAPAGPLSGLHVLVVDDERALRRMATRMLQRLGATSEALDDGKHVLRVLRKRGQVPLRTSGKGAQSSTTVLSREGSDAGSSQASAAPGPRFDLILMDIVMVHSRGTDVCKHLLEAGCVVPIFAMTANHDAWNLPGYREAGFYGLLPKPFSQGLVRTKLLALRESGVLEAARGEEEGRRGVGLDELWGARDPRLYPRRSNDAADDDEAAGAQGASDGLGKPNGEDEDEAAVWPGAVQVKVQAQTGPVSGAEGASSLAPAPAAEQEGGAKSKKGRGRRVVRKKKKKEKGAEGEGAT